MPTVSIIVPVYNVADYVNVCLESIANQSHASIEVIVVDDGSSDGSGAICDLWAERDARFVVVHQENRGLSAARNAGLDVATGEYVQFVDSDDYVDERYTETLLRHAMRLGCTCVVCGYATQRNGSWETVSPSPRPTVLSARDGVRMALGTRGGDRERVSYVVWNRIYRRSLFQAGGIRFPEGRVYEDMCVLVPTFCASGSVAFVPDVLYYSREREGSITQAVTATHVRDYVDACETIRKDVASHFPELLPLAEGLCARSHVISWLLRAGETGVGVD